MKTHLSDWEHFDPDTDAFIARMNAAVDKARVLAQAIKHPDDISRMTYPIRRVRPFFVWKKRLVRDAVDAEGAGTTFAAIQYPPHPKYYWGYLETAFAYYGCVDEIF